MNLIDTTTYTRKKIHFDIIPYYLNPKACKADIESVKHTLKSTYGGRYQFIGDEKLAVDAHGKPGIIRRNYLVDIEQAAS